MTATEVNGGTPGNAPVAILRTEELTAGYGSFPVIHEIEMEVHEGEVVALLGPNGAGKSTTLLTICGHLTPTSGSVWLNGVVSKAPLHRRCRSDIAFVTEERAMFPSLTTAENLRLGRGGVDAALEIMPELVPLLKRKAGLLSGGEQQMMALSRAIASRPRLLVADELSLGLAPMIVQHLLQVVRTAADSGIGVLLVEQYARRALEVADRIYVMRRGRIAMSGTADEIRDQLAEVEGMYLSADQV
jgi:branched-chain amino acid transport system ATP-binding protein